MFGEEPEPRPEGDHDTHERSVFRPSLKAKGDVDMVFKSAARDAVGQRSGNIELAPFARAIEPVADTDAEAGGGIRDRADEVVREIERAERATVSGSVDQQLDIEVLSDARAQIGEVVLVVGR